MWSSALSVSVLLSTTLGASARSIAGRYNSGFPDPSLDPFYAVPSNIGTYKPGQVLKSRTVPTFITGNFSASYQLSYRTTDGQGQAVSTVATLWVPKFPHNPPQILSYQYAEDSVTLDCAPSWAWVQNSGSQNAEFGVAEGPLIIPWALTAGYYVIQPDAEGPSASWLVGKMEGQAVLDGIRAARNFESLNNPQVAMYGYSGGAHSSVWGASLAASYAPELNIVGAAFGGTPVDLESAALLLNGSTAAALYGGALYGLANGYPQLKTELAARYNGKLTPQGMKLGPQLLAANYCIPSRGSDLAGVNISSYFTGDILTDPVVQHVLSLESLLTNVSSITVPVPKFPRFQYHGNTDTTVPYGPEAAYVQQQCAKGANIQFRTFAGADHGTTAVAGIPNVQLFIAQAFAGITPKVQCGTTNVIL